MALGVSAGLAGTAGGLAIRVDAGIKALRMTIEGERRLAPVRDQEADGEGEGYGRSRIRADLKVLARPWVFANCPVEYRVDGGTGSISPVLIQTGLHTQYPCRLRDIPLQQP